MVDITPDTTSEPSYAEPMYAGTVEDLGWSPDQLRPPFDVDAVIAASYAEFEPPSCMS